MGVTDLDNAAPLVIDRRAVGTTMSRRPLASIPTLEVAAPTYLRYVKPVVDRAFASVLLVVVTPFLLSVALAVRLTMGRGILFRQRRIGEGGVPFTVFKFRTMHHERRARRVSWDGVDRRRTHKTTTDPRHTPLGRFLRKWSLDELPQLFNVLRGEMSLVGPRPELVDVVAQYQPWEHARHAVRPGLTGLWQIRSRSAGPMHLFTHVDLEYVCTASPLTDLRILLATLPAVLGSQKGS